MKDEGPQAKDEQEFNYTLPKKKKRKKKTKEGKGWCYCPFCKWGIFYKADGSWRGLNNETYSRNNCDKCKAHKIDARCPACKWKNHVWVGGKDNKGQITCHWCRFKGVINE